MIQGEAIALLKHDPEKLAGFSDKIMRQNKKKENAIDSRRSDSALVYDSMLELPPNALRNMDACFY